MKERTKDTAIINGYYPPLINVNNHSPNLRFIREIMLYYEPILSGVSSDHGAHAAGGMSAQCYSGWR
jgi:hypothetical protein